MSHLSEKICDLRKKSKKKILGWLIKNLEKIGFKLLYS